MFWSRLSRSGPVLVEPSDVVLRNAGDMAMLEVALTRLAALFPDTSILVLSDTPDLLPRYVHNVVPLDTVGRRAWLRGDVWHPAARAFVDVVAVARLIVVPAWEASPMSFATMRWGCLARSTLRSGMACLPP